MNYNESNDFHLIVVYVVVRFKEHEKKQVTPLS